jgi:hypothetical protein
MAIGAERLFDKIVDAGGWGGYIVGVSLLFILVWSRLL